MAGTGSISHVEVKGYDGDSWVGLSNHWGAAWEIANAPNYPLDIRIVNDKGQEVRAGAAVLMVHTTLSLLDMCGGLLVVIIVIVLITRC